FSSRGLRPDGGGRRVPCSGDGTGPAACEGREERIPRGPPQGLRAPDDPEVLDRRGASVAAGHPRYRASKGPAVREASMTGSWRDRDGGFRVERSPNGWLVGRFAALERIGVPHMVTTREGPDVQRVRYDPATTGQEI